MSEKVKILYIVSTLARTGPVNILYSLLKYLDRDKYYPEILTLSPEPEDTRIGDFLALDLTVHSVSLSRFKSLIRGKQKVREKVAEIAPHIVHSCGFRPDVLTAKVLRNYYTISTVQNFAFEDYTMLYGKVTGSLMAATHLKCLYHFDKVCPVSNAVSNKMKQRGYTYPMDVIPNGIDAAHFKAGHNKEEYRKKLQLDANAKLIVSVGYLIPRKNPVSIVRAFVKQFGNDTNYHLLFVGDGPLMDECKKLATSNVHFYGMVKDPLPYLYASDYIISSSKSEGMPLAILEGMAVGLLPILSDIPQHLEMLYSKEYPFVFKTESEEDLQAKLKSVKQLSDDSYQVKSQEVLTHFTMTLTASIMCDSYERLYESAELS